MSEFNKYQENVLKASSIVRLMEPTKLKLIDMSDERVRLLRPVKSLDVYDGITDNFHPDGLYSTEIFGRVGTFARDNTFSYIDLKLKIFHPKYYRDLVRLKELYGEILAGRKTARFDNTIKDFVESSEPGSGTGYSFFIKYFNSIEFKRNKSPARQLRIEFIEKNRKNAFTTRVPVIPAGLRDIEEGPGGRSKSEINDLYYRLISVSNNVISTNNLDDASYDLIRYVMTNTYLEIHDLIIGMLEGKNGLLQKKFGSRNVIHSTRNVISVMDTSSPHLDSHNAPSFDSTIFGFFQIIKSMEPIAIYLLRSRILNSVFSVGDSSVTLINPDTLEREYIDIPPTVRDIWTTKEGLQTVINTYFDDEARHRPVIVEGRYVALIYKAPGVFKIFYDIRDLPEGFDKSNVYPISLIEMLYLCGYDRWNKYYATTTRYPVAGDDSIYPAKIYVKTTSVGEVRKELDHNWEPYDDNEHIALEFPRSDVNSFYNTQSPHGSKLDGLKADFDGDTASGIVALTDEANEECRHNLSQRTAWVALNGQLRASCAFATLNLITYNMTGGIAP